MIRCLLLLAVSVATVATVATLGAAPARAATEQSERRVAVMAAPDVDDSAQRLAAELGALGFEAVMLAPPATAADPAVLAARADELDVAALIALTPEADTVSIWVVDRVTGKTLQRTIDVPPREDPDRARVVALRTIELLRASLRELESGPPPEAEVDPPPPARQLLRPARPRASIQLGPAIAGAPGGLGPSVHIAAGARWMVHPRVGLGVDSLIPTIAPKVVGEAGFARVTIAIVDAGARVGLRRPSATVVPEVGAAVGLAVLRMDGAARAPARGVTDHVVTSSLRASAGVAVSLRPRVRARLDGGLGMLLPRPAVVFVDETVARWGRPYGTGALSLELVFE